MKQYDLIIIGGGFSGILLARNTQQLLPNFKIGLISTKNALGGTAYSQASKNVVLNVPHWNMSAFPDQPEHFTNFIQNQKCELLDQAFARRQDYHQYLLSIATEFEQQGGQIISDFVVKVEQQEACWKITGENNAWQSTQLVLAVGNFLPREIRGGSVQNIIENNPWNPNLYDDLQGIKHLAIIGTGLTAIDIVWELKARDHQCQITLISRRGLLPASHDLSKKPIAWSGPTDKLRPMLKHLREQSAVHNWRSILDGLRPLTSKVWSELGSQQQSKFIKHLRPYWDTARHRIASTIAEELQQQINIKKLAILKARVAAISATDHPKQALLTLHQKNGKKAVLFVNKIINCTGPQNLSSSSSELLESLFDSGLIEVDRHGIGLSTDHQGRLLAQGKITPKLYAIGPLRKGSLWENTAVPELRNEAKALAAVISNEQQGLTSLSG